MILSKVRRAERDLGTLAYLWNPAIVMEVAGEGHNDLLVVLLVLLTLLLTLSRRALWVVVVMTAAVLTKYVPALLLPLQIRYLWRGSQERSRLLAAQLALGAVLGLSSAVALFAPFWVGVRTFEGVRHTGRAGHTGSTQTLVVEASSRVFPGADSRTSGPHRKRSLADRSGDVGDDEGHQQDPASGHERHGGGDLHPRSPPADRPWYVITPLALLALLPDARNLLLVVVISLVPYWRRPT